MRTILIICFSLLSAFGEEEARGKQAGSQDLKLSLEVVSRAKDEIQIRMRLENVSQRNLHVQLPGFFYAFNPETMMGGYQLQLKGPDGTPAKVELQGPPPSPAPLAPRDVRTAMLVPGGSVGLLIPLKGELADSSKLVSIIAQYEIQQQMLDMVIGMERLRKHEGYRWTQMDHIPMWTGKVVSEPLVLHR